MNESRSDGMLPGAAGQTRFVFFDVDHTLTAGSTLIGFFEQLKLVHVDQVLIAAVRDLEERAARTGYQDHERLVADAFALLAGQSVDFAFEVGRLWFERCGRSQLVQVTGSRLREHQLQGDVVVFVSGSWLPSLAPIAAHYGVAHVLCCRPEHVDGIFTGVVPDVVVGQGKVRAITDFLVDQKGALDGSVGYGDDPTDVPMLELVSRAVAVGENAVLRDVARRRGWEWLTTGIAEREPS